MYRRWKARAAYKHKKRLIEKGIIHIYTFYIFIIIYPNYIYIYILYVPKGEYWEPVDDGSGNIYYYNRKTGAMRWDKPVQEETKKSRKKDHWEEVVDDNGVFL